MGFFSAGRASPCVVYHKARGIRLVVHRDNFAALGKDKEFDWYWALVTTRFEAKVAGRIGPGRNDAKAMRVLNRIANGTPTGIEYEDDQRHANHFLRDWDWRRTAKEWTHQEST